MDITLHHIKSEYYDLIQLKSAIQDGHGFLVTSEPDKENSGQQHDIWNHLRTSKDFEFVDVSEVEKIETYAKIHGVRPWQE